MSEDRSNTPICKIAVYAVHDCKNEQELFDKIKDIEYYLDDKFGNNWIGQIDSFYFSGCYKSIGHDDFYDAVKCVKYPRRV